MKVSNIMNGDKKNLCLIFFVRPSVFTGMSSKPPIFLTFCILPTQFPCNIMYARVSVRIYGTLADL